MDFIIFNLLIIFVIFPIIITIYKKHKLKKKILHASSTRSDTELIDSLGMFDSRAKRFAAEYVALKEHEIGKSFGFTETLFPVAFIDLFFLFQKKNAPISDLAQAVAIIIHDSMFTDVQYNSFGPIGWDSETGESYFILAEDIPLLLILFDTVMCFQYAVSTGIEMEPTINLLEPYMPRTQKVFIEALQSGHNNPFFDLAKKNVSIFLSGDYLDIVKKGNDAVFSILSSGLLDSDEEE